VATSAYDDPFVALDPWQGVYVALRTAILNGEYAPGERLVEADLALRFRTSRGPIRSALKELERRGLVVIAPRRGTFVRSFTTNDVEEILTLWELMWGFAVQRAVERMTATDMEQLAAMVNAMPAGDDPEGLLDYSIRFHRRVFEISGHGRALEIFDDLVSQAHARLVMLSAAGHWVEGDMGQPAPELLAALRRGDVNAAVDISCRWSREMGSFLEAHAADAGADATDAAHTADRGSRTLTGS